MTVVNLEVKPYYVFEKGRYYEFICDRCRKHDNCSGAYDLLNIMLEGDNPNYYDCIEDK